MLVLGWQVDGAGNPRYWLKPDARVGGHSLTDLVTVPAKSIGTHTAIIAQSGSGKSFLLGRLIEEIMLRTRARCVICDPNADFRRIHEVAPDSLWQSTYELQRQRGKLPHESTRKAFSDPWATVSKRIRMRNPRKSDAPAQEFQLWWPDVSAAFLAEDVEPMLRGDVYHCHTFVKAVSTLLQTKGEATDGAPFDLITQAESVFKKVKALSDLEAATVELRKEFDVDVLSGARPAALLDQGFEEAEIEAHIRTSSEKAIAQLLALASRVSDEVARFYFGKALLYSSTGILEKRSGIVVSSSSSAARLEVIDLPSFPDSETRLLAINSVIEAEWERARDAWRKAMRKPEADDDRVPTFIVVDEAHNVVPSDTRGSSSQAALREQFRRIAAEGRKFGLFLILVSQRPEKLDPLVVSECENKVVMRLGSAAVLEGTRKMLGLEDVAPKTLEKCLDFGTGRALIIGEWTDGTPQLLYSAARRTVEGGRNLRSDHWAQL
jgi:hypothetical protein